MFLTPPKRWCVFSKFGISFSRCFYLFYRCLHHVIVFVRDLDQRDCIDEVVLFYLYVFFVWEGGIGDVVRNSNRMESVNSNAVTPAFSPETFIKHGGQSSPTTQKLKNNSFVFWNFLGPLANLFCYWIWMAYPVANWVGNSLASFDWRYWSFLVGVACQFLSTILTFLPTWSRIRDGLFVEEASKWVTWARTMLNNGE